MSLSIINQTTCIVNKRWLFHVVQCDLCVRTGFHRVVCLNYNQTCALGHRRAMALEHQRPCLIVCLLQPHPHFKKRFFSSIMWRLRAACVINETHDMAYQKAISSYNLISILKESFQIIATEQANNTSQCYYLLSRSESQQWNIGLIVHRVLPASN